MTAADEAHHVTEIDGPDSAGHWGWRCTLGDADASGYDDPNEVIDAAEDHGPLAADSLRPVYWPEDGDSR